MYLMSGPSEIMQTDEKVLVRREATDLGGDTIVVDGKRVKRGHRDFVVYCNVQPVTGDDLIQVPEGDRFNEQLFCYVSEYDYVPDQDRYMAPNDLVWRLDDGWYQVQSCEGWGSYTRARIQRIEVGRYRSGIDGPGLHDLPEGKRLLLQA